MRVLFSLAVLWSGIGWAAPLVDFSLSAGVSICAGSCTYGFPSSADPGFAMIERPHPQNGRNGYNASFLASAEQREGFWRMRTSNQGSYWESYSSAAGVAIRDSLNIGTGSLLVIPVRVTGSAIVSYAGPPSTTPYNISAGVSLALNCGIAILVNGQLRAGPACTGGGTAFTDNGAFDQVIEYRIPFVAGQEFALDLSALLQSSGPILTGDLSGLSGGIPSAYIVGDFGHTGVLLPAQVYDAEGNLLSGVDVIGGGGFNYLAPPGEPVGDEAPEPASVFLVGVGLAGVWWAKRGR